MANAHRNRHGNVEGCVYCQFRPKEAKALGKYRNKNGHRHNGHSKKRGRRNPTRNVK